MTDDPIPEDVKRLIADRVPSVAHVEAIMLLRSDPEQEWDVDTIARRLYINADAASRVLDDLNRSSIVTVRSNSPLRYCYHPGSLELGELLDRLADLYRRHLIAVTALIHSNVRSPLQRFADAFRIRKD